MFGCLSRFWRACWARGYKAWTLLQRGWQLFLAPIKAVDNYIFCLSQRRYREAQRRLPPRTRHGGRRHNGGLCQTPRSDIPHPWRLFFLRGLWGQVLLQSVLQGGLILG
jgi:hypothetical protein